MKTPSTRSEHSKKSSRMVGIHALMVGALLCLNCSWRLLETEHGVLESTAKQGMWGWKMPKGDFCTIKKNKTPSLSPVQVCHYAEILLCTIKIQPVLLKAELPFNGIRQYSKKTGAEMNIISNRNHYNSKQRNLFKYRRSRIDRGRKGEKCNYIGKNSSIRELVQLEFIFCPWIKTWAWPITKLKSPLPCSYAKYFFIFQGALLIWGGRCVSVWLGNKYISILSQGLTFQNMPKSQWGEEQSTLKQTWKTGRKEQHAT